MSDLQSSRFSSETGFRVNVQVPKVDVARIMDAVLGIVTLTYGDYDQVAFSTAPGIQQYRSLGGGRNPAMTEVVTVPCVELSFFLPANEAEAVRVIEAIYNAHPYEEPVIHVLPCTRTLHIRGLDEENPNRFWNRPAADWLPEPFGGKKR